MKSEYRPASSGSQVELELASRVLNALKNTLIALLQIKMIMGTEVLNSIDATSIRS